MNIIAPRGEDLSAAEVNVALLSPSEDPVWGRR